MRSLLFALVIVVAGQAAPARAAGPLPPQGDPLRSADCRRALDALQVQEAAATATPRASRPSGDRRPGAADARLAAARRQAAQACLASRADPPPRPQRLAQPPVAVPPVTLARPTDRPSRRADPASRAGPPPKPAEPPRFILSCDAGGCWANDGSRLDRVGPDLWSRRGLCTVQGTLLQCP